MNPDEVHLWHENYYYCLMKLTERRPRVCSTINKSKHCYFQKLYLSNWEYALYNIYALQISYYYWLIYLADDLLFCIATEWWENDRSGGQNINFLGSSLYRHHQKIEKREWVNAFGYNLYLTWKNQTVNHLQKTSNT